MIIDCVIITQTENMVKLYTLSILHKGSDGKVKKLISAYELSSFGYFQKKR